MDYEFKQVTNGYFDVVINEPVLDKGWCDNCYRYDYVLGDNELTLSLLEFENSRYLEHFKAFRNELVEICLTLYRPSARNRFKDGMQKYHTISFHDCRMVRYTNNGHVDRVGHSTVKVMFQFDDYDVGYE